MTWNVYKRGNIYRIGKPGRFWGITWLRDSEYGMIDEYFSLNEAVARRNKANMLVDWLEQYEMDQWRIV